MDCLIRSLSSIVVLVMSTAPVAASLTVGGGSRVDFGDAVIDLGCQDLFVAGQAGGTAEKLNSIASLSIAAGGSFAPGVGTVALGVDFSNVGSFVPGSSGIAVVDACGNGTSHVSGASSFYDLSVETASAKQLVLQA